MYRAAVSRGGEGAGGDSAQRSRCREKRGWGKWKSLCAVLRAGLVTPHRRSAVSCKVLQRNRTNGMCVRRRSPVHNGSFDL